MSQQPSISRFFKKSPAKQQSNTLQQHNEQAKAKETQRKLDQDAIQKVNIENSLKRSRHFSYSKSLPQDIIEQSDSQKELQNKFKKKLNQISFNPQHTQKEDADDEDEEDHSDVEPQPPLKKSKKQAKLTPLDQQVKDLKLNHMDKILAVQVGYKYKFYCQDALIVHKILNIMLIPGKLNLVNETASDLLYNKLAYCSIPEQRLHIHLQRLLDAGLKVGIVDQTESQIIKSVDSSSGLFKREISNVFTKATYLEFSEKDSIIKNNKALDSIVAIIEQADFITLVSIQPLTGDIIYDEFEDDFMKNELQTRLSHLEPLEFLYFENNLSKSTQSILNQFKATHSSIREIKYHESKRSYYQNYLNEYIDDSIVEFMIEKSTNFKICCSILVDYLKEFGLDSAFSILSNYVPFSQSNHMILNSNSLSNLEILQNSTNLEEYGSLIWVLDHTRTKFGYRLLKTWISKPLISREMIEKRLDSVEEIRSNFNHFLENLANILKNCYDLEKILNRIHYSKVKRKEMYLFLNKLNEFERCVIKFGKLEILAHIKSDLLKNLLKNLIQAILKFNPSDYLKMINSQYALDESNMENHVLKYFNLDYLNINQDDIIQQTLALEEIEGLLDDELKQIRTLLKRPSLEFIEKSKEPYLIEVRNGLVKMVPKDWVKINATKSVSRFRSPRTIELHKQFQYHQELYSQACHSIFQRFVSKIDEDYQVLNTIIKDLSTYDCLLSLSTTSSQTNYTRPNFVDSKIISLKQSTNPILQALSTSNYVPNDIFMDKDSSHLIITGPNMGGKSSIVKQIALCQIMAQIGCFIPAESATLSVLNTILTRMGAQDDLIKGESTFYTEMSQVFKILKDLKSSKGHSLIILDEIGRGTGTVDGISIASSILEYLIQEQSDDSLVLFITHFPSLCKLTLKYDQLKNYHMRYAEQMVENTNWPKVTFLYELYEGISKNSYGLNVAKLAGVNDSILNEAYEVSKSRQQQVELNKLVKDGKRFGELIERTGDKDAIVEGLKKLIEEFD